MPPKYTGRRPVLQPIGRAAGGNAGGAPPSSSVNGNRGSLVSIHADSAALVERANSRMIRSDGSTGNGDGGSSSIGDSTVNASASFTRRAAPLPPKRSRSPIFWCAEKETPLFRGPLGEPVGRVEEGTVLRELSRYEDPFGGWWFSTRSSDGSVVWLSYYPPEVHPMEQPEEVLWNRVFDSRATPESDSTLRRDQQLKIQFRHPFRTVGGGNEVLCFSQSSLVEASRGIDQVMPSDVELIDFYWRNLSSSSKGSSEPEGSAPHSTKDFVPPSLPDDWNHRYQSALEDYYYRSTTGEETLRKHHEALQNIINGFREVVEEYTVLLVEELAKPSFERSMKTHPVFRHVFYHKGLLMRLIVDTPSGFFGGDTNAVKYAKHQFTSLQLLASQVNKFFLHHPLCSICSFKGHVVWAMAIPPITLDNCVHAPLAVAHRRVSASTVAMMKMLNVDNVLSLCAELGETLNLKEHVVHSAAENTEGDTLWKTTLPVTTELYGGRDKRLYLFLATSLLPPVPSLQIPIIRKPPVELPKSATQTKGINNFSSVPSPKVAGIGLSSEIPKNSNRNRQEEVDTSRSTQPKELSSPGTNGLIQTSGTTPQGISYIPMSAASIRRLRPEMLLSLSEHVNPDTFTHRCYDTEDEQMLLSVSEQIRGSAISAVADMFGFHRAVERIPSLPRASCTLCHREMDDEMRFVVCYNANKCCKICSHCYCQRMSEAYSSAVGHKYAGEEALTRVRFDDAVRCGHRERTGHALLPEPSIRELMHSHGLNMSYLPFIFHRLPLASTFAVEHFCKVEMCARVAAEVLQERLAAVVEPEEVQSRVAEFLAAFLSSHGTAAEALWAEDIGPAFMKKYPALGEPLFLSYMSAELLAERTQETCGVELTQESFCSLRSTNAEGECFVEVKSMFPRTKIFAVPQLTLEAANALTEKLGSWLERLLMFWIGFTSDSTYDDEHQPFYLVRGLA